MTHAGVALLDPHPLFTAMGLSGGMRVADFGCGRTGHFIFPLSRIVGERGIVYAVDVVQDILQTIQSRARAEGFNNVQTVWSNIEMPGATSIPARSLDAALVVNVLSTLQEPQKAMEEAARVTAAHGKVAVVDWNKNLGVLGPSAGKVCAPATVKQWAQNAGLTFLKQIPLGEYHYALILQKNS